MSAVALIAGCSLFAHTDLLYLESQLPVGYEVTFTVHEGARQHIVRTAEMGVRVPPHVRHTALTVKEGRSLRVGFVVTKSAADTIASGDVDLPVADNNIYSVTILRGPAGPPPACLGCSGVRSYPSRGSEAGTSTQIEMSYAARRPCRNCVY